MGRLVTFSEIRNHVAERYDLPTFSSSGWSTLTNINRHINESLQRFHAMLAECYGDNYLLTNFATATSPNVALTSLPSDFYKLSALSWRKSADSAIPIRRGNVDDLRKATMTPRAWSNPKFVLTGSTITWCPVPDAAYTVDIWYQALPADLVSDSDVFDAGPGWLEWVVLDVCRKLASREQKDPSVWLAELSQAESLVRSQAPDRAETDSPCVRDVIRRRGFGDLEIRDLITYGDE